MFTLKRTHRAPVPTQTHDVVPIVDNTELIVVRMHAPGRGVWREAFTGKWVAGEWCDVTWQETRMSWKTGITNTGRPVAYRALMGDEKTNHKHGGSPDKCESLLRVFDTIEEFADEVVRAGHPASCVKYALRGLAHAIIRHHADW